MKRRRDTWWRRLWARRSPPLPEPGGNGRAAEQAAERARRKLAHARSQQPAVDAVVRETRRLRAENHFGEAIEEAMRRRGRPA